MFEMDGFQRHRNENINEVLARFETVRLRAAEEGGYHKSVEARTL